MKTVVKNIGLGVVIGSLLFLFFTVLDWVSGRNVIFDNDFFMNWLYYIIFSIPLTLVNGYYFQRMNAKKEWKFFKDYKVIVIAAGSVVLTMITIFLTRAFLEMVINNKDFEGFIAAERPIFYLYAFVITMVISIIVHAIYFYKAIQDKKVKEHKIVAGTEKAKYESLKSQLDPHFLFNSLNVLTSLIDENPEIAQDFTTSLSKVYRYVLEQKDKDLVSVNEELKFAKTYMSLLKMRFENAIEFDIPSGFSNPEAKVVPLSLQILLENCIKHNVVSEQKPLKIEIKESNNSLVVINNFQPKQTLKTSSGVGLRNIKERYQILTHRKVNINQSENEFMVSVPLLTKQASIMRRESTVSENNSYVRARKRLDTLKEFYGSLLSYIIVIPFLAIINYKTYWGVQWFWFPAFGWGIGLAFQAFEVYGKNRYFGKSWEEKKIKEYMEEEHQNNNRWE